MNAWLSVDIGLPEIKDEPLVGLDSQSREVLVLTKNKQIWIAYLYQWDEEYPAQWKIKGRDGYDLDNVTHWQELPAI